MQRYARYKTRREDEGFLTLVIKEKIIEKLF